MLEVRGWQVLRIIDLVYVEFGSRLMMSSNAFWLSIRLFMIRFKSSISANVRLACYEIKNYYENN